MGSEPRNIPKHPTYIRSRQSRRWHTICIRFASQIPHVPLAHCNRRQLATLKRPRMPWSRSFHIHSAVRAAFITPRPPYTPTSSTPLLVVLAPDPTSTLSPQLLVMPAPHLIPLSSPLVEPSPASPFTYLPPTFLVRSSPLQPPSYNQSPGSQRTLHNIEFFAFEDKGCRRGRNRDLVQRPTDSDNLLLRYVPLSHPHSLRHAQHPYLESIANTLPVTSRSVNDYAAAAIITYSFVVSNPIPSSSRSSTTVPCFIAPSRPFVGEGNGSQRRSYKIR
jgi:hypothetical protein